jgi:hypothetical protein
MAQTQQRYKKLLEADEVAFEGEIESAYMESMGINSQHQQTALTGTATLDSTTSPGDKVQQSHRRRSNQNSHNRAGPSCLT